MIGQAVLRPKSNLKYFDDVAFNALETGFFSPFLDLYF